MACLMGLGQRAQGSGHTEPQLDRLLDGLAWWLAWWGALDALCQSLIYGSSPCVPHLAPHPAPLQVGTRGPFSPVLRFNLDAHLQGAAALHTPLSYKQHMDLISLILGCRRVIMFLCASRLPSFAPGHRPSRGSQSQVTAGRTAPQAL